MSSGSISLAIAWGHLVRSALAMTRPRKLGSLSYCSRAQSRCPAGGFGPATLRPTSRRGGGALLASDSYVNRLAPAADLDCGVIAASWDHVVSLASTHLPSTR